MASETKFKAYFAELDKMAGKDNKGLERALEDLAFTARNTTSVLAEDFYRLLLNDTSIRDALELDPDMIELLPYIGSVRTLGAWRALFQLVLDNSGAPPSNLVHTRLTGLTALLVEAMKL